MSGRPYEALKTGSLMVGKSIFDAPDFELFATCLYDTSASGKIHKDSQQFEALINSSYASGSTNFVAVFQYIESFVQQNEVTDISVIFFTDGCDTCNNKSQITAALDNMKNFLKKKQIISRFLAIGFTSSHDATFLNQIAMSGSELGNFIYVNTE